MTFTTQNKAGSVAIAQSAMKGARLNNNNTQQPKIDDATVSAYMSQSYLPVSIADSVACVKKNLIEHLDGEQIPTYLFVVDQENYLNGILSVKSLLAADEGLLVSDIMRHNYFSVAPDQSRHDVYDLINHSGLDMIPVVQFGKLMGVLRPQDIAELIEDENTLDAQLQGATTPLEEPYLATSPITLWRKRVVWLLMLFVAEAYTGTVLKAFEEQLEAAISLAFFIPLLIGTGGNSGTQITSTLVRAMALGEVSLRNLGAVLKKEVSTSFLVAVTIGAAALIRAWILGVGAEVTIVVSLTIVAITMWSAIVSSIIPMVLKKLKVDPAVVSAPFIATFIDGTGLIIYFEIAKLVMTEFA
ncbi:TPA: magnesium transporter [Providencia stuartii]|uniref:Extended ORF of mgtE gene; transcription from this start point is unlikely n=5 Tax=Gammaproteobacteria TaxID=1236 RepID=Q52398_PROST|nr:MULTISPECIES: magnesium transporter [Providencia]SST03193.1 Mg transporter (MgtE) [Acinetobacter baumannii]AAA85578.1 extended ORF of mgtE gene; transcription from this start point is unlikely [Providencia stuartii]AFH92692.1 magnesium transport protein MgtE [Providencia stuartii MRSN 2154]AIN63858.1 divalent cation transporter family protein [Providencia stuartii]AMG65119.1 magnesium transporter [Providencia stuartii]